MEQSAWAQKTLASKVNDNVLRNIDQFSVASYDSDQKRYKDALSTEQRDAVVSKLLESEDASKQLDKAVDKILKAHRNTKILLFMLTGPFLVFFQLFKYSLKYGIPYYFYKRHQWKKQAAELQQAAEQAH